MKRRLFAAALGASLTSCTTLFYKASKTVLNREKRDILTSRIKAARKDQEEAKEQFKSTLEAFQSVTGFKGGKLEDVYKKLNGELEDCDNRAKDVSERIDSIEKVAGDMFREWGKEIDQISDRSLKTQSRALLRGTEQRYQALASKMRDTERRMKPVLTKFRDQVLFLKHNLNARAIQSLRDNAVKMDGEVTLLIKDMDASIQEAGAFIETLSTEQAS